ncbi:MAG: PLD nuclease N-terminal domain-containing protein [Nanoarchaeota archaeon]|nr:PLD nuclease N-terminal domain-containing protein [Nanoarchaeota archaeon]
MLGKIWGILSLIAVIWVIIDILPRRKSVITKVLWIVIALVFNILGAIAYYFLGRK